MSMNKEQLSFRTTLQICSTVESLKFIGSIKYCLKLTAKTSFEESGRIAGKEPMLTPPSQVEFN